MDFFLRVESTFFFMTQLCPYFCWQSSCSVRVLTVWKLCLADVWLFVTLDPLAWSSRSLKYQEASNYFWEGHACISFFWGGIWWYSLWSCPQFIVAKMYSWPLGIFLGKHLKSSGLCTGCSVVWIHFFQIVSTAGSFPVSVILPLGEVLVEIEED